MQSKNENKEKDPIPFISKKINIDINQLKTILTPNSNHGVCGSENLGNTCYMNSSIACLSNCVELTAFFLTKEFRKYKNTSNKNGLNGKLAEEWYNLLKYYWKEKDEGEEKEGEEKEDEEKEEDGEEREEGEIEEKNVHV